MGRVAGLFMNVVLGEGILIQILTMVWVYIDNSSQMQAYWRLIREWACKTVFYWLHIWGWQSEISGIVILVNTYLGVRV